MPPPKCADWDNSTTIGRIRKKFGVGRAHIVYYQEKKFFVSRALEALVRAREPLAREKNAIFENKKSLFFWSVRFRWQYFFRQNFLVAENALKKAQKNFWARRNFWQNLRALWKKTFFFAYLLKNFFQKSLKYLSNEDVKKWFWGLGELHTMFS